MYIFCPPAFAKLLFSGPHAQTKEKNYHRIRARSLQSACAGLPRRSKLRHSVLNGLLLGSTFRKEK